MPAFAPASTDEMNSSGVIGLAMPMISAELGGFAAPVDFEEDGGVDDTVLIFTLMLAFDDPPSAKAAEIAPGLIETAALGSSGMSSIVGIAVLAFFAFSAISLAPSPKSLSMTLNSRFPSSGSSAINSSLRFNISSTGMPICLLRRPRRDSRSSGPTAPESTICSNMSTAFSIEGPPNPPERERSRPSPLAPPIIDFITRCMVSCISLSAFCSRIFSNGASRDTVSRSTFPPGAGLPASSSSPIPMAASNSGVARVSADVKTRSSLRLDCEPSYRTSPMCSVTPSSPATTAALLTKRQRDSAASANWASLSMASAAASTRSSSIARPTSSAHFAIAAVPSDLSVAFRASVSVSKISRANAEAPSISLAFVSGLVARLASAPTSTGARNAHAMVLQSSALSSSPMHSSSTVGP
mmetsp:Transcript_25454/g.77294  ORF Transcript_25454/g.77294 Transcript_25454/m.77294 type:complete len:412 (-) Transcript_25454:1022-2257(-)